MSNIQTVDTDAQIVATQTNNELTEFMGHSDSWKLFMSKMPERRQEAILFDLYAYVNKNAEVVVQMQPNEFMARVVECYGQGFTLQDGDSYILPFWNEKEKRKVATHVPGYKGVVRLAMQTGLFKYFDCVPVIAESIKSFDYKRHVPIFDETYIPTGEEKTIGYFAYSETHDGMIREIYHSVKYYEDFAIRKSPMCRAKKEIVGVWNTDFDSMCKKTGLKELGKLAPKVKNPTEQQAQFFNYVEAEEEMTEQLNLPQNVDEDGVLHEEYVCTVCGKAISEEIHAAAIKNYGIDLCSKKCRDTYLSDIGQK